MSLTVVLESLGLAEGQRSPIARVIPEHCRGVLSPYPVRTGLSSVCLPVSCGAAAVVQRASSLPPYSELAARSGARVGVGLSPRLRNTWQETIGAGNAADWSRRRSSCGQGSCAIVRLRAPSNLSYVVAGDVMSNPCGL